MSRVESSAEVVAEELGLHLPYLQPVHEARFDPATLAVVVALYLLRSVADGIAEAVKQPVTESTTALLASLSRAVHRRAKPGVDKAMASSSDNAALDRLSASVEVAWVTARALVHDADARDVAAASASSVKKALIEAGLPEATADRVCAALRAELSRLLEEQ